MVEWMAHMHLQRECRIRKVDALFAKHAQTWSVRSHLAYIPRVPFKHPIVSLPLSPRSSYGL